MELKSTLSKIRKTHPLVGTLETTCSEGHLSGIIASSKSSLESPPRFGDSFSLSREVDCNTSDSLFAIWGGVSTPCKSCFVGCCFTGFSFFCKKITLKTNKSRRKGLNLDVLFFLLSQLYFATRRYQGRICDRKIILILWNWKVKHVTKNQKNSSADWNAWNYIFEEMSYAYLLIFSKKTNLFLDLLFWCSWLGWSAKFNSQI